MNIALIFAGGAGKRMNSKGIPKQFLEINGVPIIIRTIEHFENHPEIDGICVVCIESWIPQLHKLLRRYEITKVIDIVPGGENGQESIYNGLRAIFRRVSAPDDTIVLIHDGVRPLINEQLITENIHCVKENGNAITIVPATETIAVLDESACIKDIQNRSMYYIARAPQCFYLRDILHAHCCAIEEGIGADMVDSAMLMAHYGYSLHTVEGPQENIKVTTPADFYMCRALLQAKENSQVWGN